MSDKIKLLTDNPLFENDLKDKDGLKFDEYTNIIKNAAINTDTPFTIGIYGEWGKGKTTFLNMIKRKIEKEEITDIKYVIVWFNAWKHEKDKDPLIALIMVITEALSEYPNLFEASKELGKDILSFLKHLTLNLIDKKTKVKSALEDKKIEEEKENEVIDKLIRDNTYLEIFKEIKELENILQKEKIRLFIFVDDLDRCHPNNALKLLENIKLVLDLENITFILGIANEVIEEHLEHKYDKVYGIKDKGHGKRYLEKIIQLPFKLPKYNKKFDSLVTSLFSKVDNTEDIRNISNVINSISEHKLVTPRMLIRIINQAKINVEIKKVLEEDSSLDMYAVFVFVLILEHLYFKEYTIFETERPSNYEKLYLLLEEYKTIVENEKDFEVLEKEFLSNIDVQENSSTDFDVILSSLKMDKVFRKLLQTKIALEWMNNKNKSLRDSTFEFVDETSVSQNNTEEKLEIKSLKKLENETLDDIKTEQERLLKEIKDNRSFNKEILNIDSDEPLYKTSFVKVKDENSKEFEISKFLVTNKWYKEINKNHNSGSGFDNDFQPVVNLSYLDIRNFCKELNKNDVYKYSLPTGNQLEYLLKSGNEYNKYLWGDNFDKKRCNSSYIDLNKTSVVGGFSMYSGDTQLKDFKNQICDISGNVWKWTSSNSKEYKGTKVLKGGSWDIGSEVIFSSSFSNSYRPRDRSFDVGFFLTRTKK